MTKQDNWCRMHGVYTKMSSAGSASPNVDPSNPTMCDECMVSQSDLSVDCCAAKYVKEHLVTLHKEIDGCESEK